MPAQKDAKDRFRCECAMAFPFGFGAIGQEVYHRAKGNQCILSYMASVVTPMPSTGSVIHLDVESVSEVARAEGPKTRRETGALQDCTDAAKNRLVPSLDDGVSFVDARKGLVMRNPEGCRRSLDFAAPVRVQELHLLRANEVAQGTLGLLTRLVRERVTRRKLSGDVVNRHRRSAVISVDVVVIGSLEDDVVARDDIAELSLLERQPNLPRDGQQERGASELESKNGQ